MNNNPTENTLVPPSAWRMNALFSFVMYAAMYAPTAMKPACPSENCPV